MSKTEEMLERIACELHELNATINCRFDALDGLVEEVSNVAGIICVLDTTLGKKLSQVTEMISATDTTLDAVRSNLHCIDVSLESMG